MRQYRWLSVIAPCMLRHVHASVLNFDFPTNTSDPIPFYVSVDPGFIEETLQKVKSYRPSVDLQDDSNVHEVEGIPATNMSALAKHWADEYDWFDTQDMINSNFSNFAVNIQGGPEYDHPVPIHFLHECSPNENAVPLLLIHGWPSTFMEWSRVIEPLRLINTSFQQNFCVVAPDLPGFGFSPAPSYSGLTPRQMGVVFDKLMQKLGYTEYGIASTDAGWYVGMWMANDFPSSVIGHYTDYFFVPANATDLERFARNQTTAEETAFILSSNAWAAQHAGYFAVQSTAPLALGQALSDSPVGFAGWTWHLIHAASDGYTYTFNELIESALLLWIQGTFGNMRIYKEAGSLLEIPRSRVPTGIGQWGNANAPDPALKALNNIPRDWVDRIVNATYVSRHEAGGHFPAHSKPQEWVEDVAQFFGTLIGA